MEPSCLLIHFATPSRRRYRLMLGWQVNGLSNISEAGKGTHRDLPAESVCETWSYSSK